MVRAVRFAIVVSILASPALARADSITATAVPTTCITVACIDFGGFGDGNGTISYAGGDAPLVGADIVVPRVFGFQTPQHSSVFGHPIVDGRLNFTTGPFLSFDPIDGYRFSGGGSLKITGAVPSIGILENSTLAEGSFTSAFMWPGFAPFVFGPSGFDTKNAQLASYFGFAPDTRFKFGGPTLTYPPIWGTGNSFTATVALLDIPNTAQPTPEPASLLLLGSGLVAAGWRRLRKR